MIITNGRVKNNKFYVGSNTIFERGWGHATVEKAISHAQDLMEEQGLDETFIVQIVRVVAKQKTPVKVTTVR